MRKSVIIGVLFAFLFFYVGYNLISSSAHDNLEPIGNTVSSRTNMTDNSINTDNGVDEDKQKIDKKISTDDRDNDKQLEDNDTKNNNTKNNNTKNNDTENNNTVKQAAGKEDNDAKIVVSTVTPQVKSDAEEQQVGNVVSSNNNRNQAISDDKHQTDRTTTAKEEIRDTSTNSTIKRQQTSLYSKIKTYQVKKGENLWGIARKFDIDIDTLIGANDITNMNKIQVGDTLKILPVKGILYKVNPGENLWTISQQFNISIDAIAEANALANPNLVKPGAILVLPGAKPEFGYQDRLGKEFIMPVNGPISSPYGPRWGKMHEGIDIAVNTGTRVKAARAGKVIFSQWASGYGWTVVIEHQKGVRTLYGHNSKLLVRGGQWVEQGQTISLSGNTGDSTGPHVHFEIQINGKPVNPEKYLK